MQQAGLAGGLADQVLMAAGEGIGIHDDCSNRFRWIGRSGDGGCFPLEAVQTVRETIPLIFHEDEGIIYAGNLIEAQVMKEAGGLYLRIKEDIIIASLLLDIHEMGDDRIEQPLALMAVIYRKAAQGIAECTARGDELIVLVDAADVVEVGVAADALRGQQGVDLCQGMAVAGEYLGNIRHGDGSFPALWRYAGGRVR